MPAWKSPVYSIGSGPDYPAILDGDGNGSGATTSATPTPTA